MSNITIKHTSGKIDEIEVCDLVGSDKQIAWARDLRSLFFASISRKLISAGSSMADPKVAPRLAKVAAESSAKFWIDNRGADSSAIIKMFA